MIINIIANRYFLGTAAFFMFAYPVIQKAGELLSNVAWTVSQLPGAAG